MTCGRFSADDSNVQGHLRLLSNSNSSSCLPAITGSAQACEVPKLIAVRSISGLPAAVETHPLNDRTLARRNVNLLPLKPPQVPRGIDSVPQTTNRKTFCIPRTPSVNSAESTGSAASSHFEVPVPPADDVRRRFQGGLNQWSRNQLLAPHHVVGNRAVYVSTGQLATRPPKQLIEKPEMKRSIWPEPTQTQTCRIDSDTEVPEDIFDAMLTAAKEVRKQGQHILIHGETARTGRKRAHLVHHDVYIGARTVSL